eukprot:GGOE01047309.1.p2 GENE.GGOE01047309.1~~GGOE01047309.1.p2  ORF type:complete len:133 (-),score=13.52 GGOE01047309.1:584-982(-)
MVAFLVVFFDPSATNWSLSVCSAFGSGTAAHQNVRLPIQVHPLPTPRLNSPMGVQQRWQGASNYGVGPCLVATTNLHPPCRPLLCTFFLKIGQVGGQADLLVWFPSSGCSPPPLPVMEGAQVPPPRLQQPIG